MASCTVEQDDIAPVSQQAQQESNAIAFGTTVGKGGTTRAGATGSIDTDVLKDANYGFGVFAYYTKTSPYNTWREGTEYVNFMYNQKVTYNASGTSEITNWTYSPIKYWPNEVIQGKKYIWETIDSGTATKNGTADPTDATVGEVGDIYKNTTTGDLFKLVAIVGVDDQNNDDYTDPATASGSYGGNLSFFAYAPYVELTESQMSTNPTLINGAVPTSATNGIIALSGNKSATGKIIASDAAYPFFKNSGKVDPYLTYELPDANEAFVDLLWGTKGATNQNVNNANNTGVTYSDALGATTYEKEILPSYTLNADLTKQTTTGRVDFLFKHALSKVGGSHQGPGEGDDEDATTGTNGLMIVLDLDDEGKESGGVLEKFDTPLNDKTPYKTKVTVKDIQIEAKMLVKDNTGKKPGDPGYVKTYYKSNQGLFDLATGRWFNDQITEDESQVTNASTGLIEHNITSPASDGGLSSSATLSEEIAEPATVAAGAAAFTNTLPIGVTTVVKNVYEGDANSLVFFPETYPELTVTIDYIVRTYDLNLANAYSSVGQKITKVLTFNDKVELNKMYNLLIHLGLTSVKFTATVSDWDVAANTTHTEDDGEGGLVEITDITVDHDIYVPINVENKLTALAVSAASATNIAATTNNADIIVATTGTASTTLSVKGTYTNGNGLQEQDVTNNVSYTSDASWLTVDAQGNISVAENKTFSDDARKATITVEYDGVQQKVDVYQYSKYVAALMLNPLTATLKKEGGTFTVDGSVIGLYKSVDTRGKDKAVISTADRALVTEPFVVNKTAGTATVSGNTITYAPNVSGSDNVIKITATYGGKTTAAATLTQPTATLASIAATTNPANATVAWTGGTVTIDKVTATYTGTDGNFDVDVTTEASVDSYSPTNLPAGTALAGKTLTVLVTAETIDKSDNLTVRYTPETGAGSVQTTTVTVTQKGK